MLELFALLRWSDPWTPAGMTRVLVLISMLGELEAPR